MKTNFNLDRKKVSSEHIESKQNFNQVLNGIKQVTPPIWKSPWFFGSVGLASIAVIIGLLLSANNESNPLKSQDLSASPVALADLKDTPCIKPLSEISDLAFSVYAIDPKKGGNIILPSGTEINIDKNSLVAGQTAPIELRIREFSNKTDAFVAGIPMDEGTENAFESAGMIEIRASQEGKEVTINPNKPIEIALSLYKNPKDFQFWFLDENEKKWKTQDALYKKNGIENNQKNIKKVEITLKKVNEKLDICQKAIDQSEEQSPGNSLLPSMGSRKLQIDFNEQDFPELKGYKDIEFEYVNYTDEVSKILKSQIWSNVSLKKAGDYVAIFSNSKGSQSVKVRPVLKGKTLVEVEKQMNEANDFHTAELNRLVEEKENLQKRSLQLQAKYDGMLEDMQLELNNTYRNSMSNRSTQLTSANLVNQASANFQMTRFGLYNCDKPIPYPAKLPEFVAFKDSYNNDLKPEAIYVFDLKKDCRYTFSRGGLHGLEELGWHNNSTSVIVLDKEGQMFYGHEAQQYNKAKPELILTKVGANGTTVDELKKIIREGIIVV